MSEEEERTRLGEQQHWKLGKLEKVYIRKDGLVRSCLLKTTESKVSRRPLQLFHSIEGCLAKSA